MNLFTIPIVIAATAISANAQAAGASGIKPDLTGVYQVIPSSAALLGGLKNSGSPKDIPLLPVAAQQMKTINLKDDPGRLCLPLGPFRMMAREQTKIELLPGPNALVMLFEDISHGHMRTVNLKLAHPQKLVSTWEGDSIGHWEGDTLVVDTVGFNDRTWLNDGGAQHSDVLHLVERIRPILAGKYLEYKVTAEDAKALAKPYSYIRYYEKLKTEIMENVCEEEK